MSTDNEYWRRLFRLERRGGRTTEQVDEELRFHIEGRIEELMAAGMGEEEAREEAMRRFGDLETIRRRTRRAAEDRIRRKSMGEFLASVGWDIRFGLRSLRRSPVLSGVAMVTLALGIGLNVAFFSVVKGVVLDPLSYSDPDRLVMLWESEPQLDHAPLTLPDFVDWRDQNSTFQEMGVMTTGNANMTAPGEPTKLKYVATSASLFSTLGIRPEIGRYFTQEEDDQDAHVLVISHAFWEEQFESDPAVIGTDITVQGDAYSIIGVLPENLLFPLPWSGWRDAEIFVPASLVNNRSPRGSHWLWCVGRLADGATVEEAKADLATIAGRLQEQYPNTNTGIGADVVPLRQQLLGNVSRDYLLLLGAVGLVLLIACANIASLLMARASARRTELAVRSSLGAGGSRLMRQMLTESALLASISGAVGFLSALWGVNILRALIPPSVPRSAAIGVDLWVFLFALVAVLLTALISGMVPAIVASRTDPNRWLREGRSSLGQTRGSNRFRDGLVVAQFAIALLLANAGILIVHSYLNVSGVEVGVQPENVLTASITLNGPAYSDGELRAAFWDRAVERVKAVPGVRTAAYTSKLPLLGGWNGTVIVEGTDWSSAAFEGPLVENSSITPGYFTTMRIQLLEGRDLLPQDSDPTAPGALINREMAEELWPDQDPLGKRFSGNRITPLWITVVGIVSDVLQFDRTQKPLPEAYYPVGWTQQRQGFLVLKTDADPASVVPALRSALREMDKNLPLADIQTMGEIIDRNMASRRFNTLLISVFAFMALLLVAGGIYGVMSFFVAQRTHEIGVRIALGARGSTVRGLVVKRGMLLAGIGLAIGGIGSLFVARLFQQMLYGVKPVDPVATGAGLLFLLLVSVAASWIPALRATQIDPIRVLGAQ